MSESREKISGETVGAVLRGEQVTLVERTEGGKTEHLIEISKDQHNRLQDRQDDSG